MKTLHELVPKPDDLLALQPEEVAALIMICLNSKTEGLGDSVSFNDIKLKGYQKESHQEISRAVSEAWMVLEREALVARDFSQSYVYYFISRKGEKLKTIEDFESYRRSRVLPREILHPQISETAWGAFLRGDYEIAVLTAFRQVEIEVRSAGKYGDNMYGHPLMRKAFDPENGPLTDRNLQKGEREGVAELYSGSIRVFKNPPSHRGVEIKIEEAVEAIMFANWLLKYVDTRRT